jgi:Ser/Thr protein kinase RdoA (MazF antagonist)
VSNETIGPYIALAEYDLGTVYSITKAGGTAGKTWKVNASSGDYFLRLRGVRTSTETRLLFDHGLREHIIAHGVPTTSAIRTKTGRWIRLSEGVYELYPYAVGRLFNADSECEIANSAKALAEFHKSALDYKPSSIQKEIIAQYTTLGFSDETSFQIDDPHLQAINMLKMKEIADSDDDQKLIDRCITRVKRSMQKYNDSEYIGLNKWIIHGDYTPANLLFSQDGNVVGIFDFDWAMQGSRCRDVADGLYFFATRPRKIDPSDIWSLTDTADFDMDRCVIFLKAYQRILPLASYEIDFIPWAFAGRWFSIRLEGMAKVHKDERFNFFSRQIEKPLLWLDTNWLQLVKQI